MPVPLHIRGMKGLGDNIFQRPFVRAAAARSEVYLETPWPELYTDLEGVRLVPTYTSLRTQQRNERSFGGRWSTPPGAVERALFTYGPRDLAKRSILESLELGVPLNAGEALVLDLPGKCQTPPARILEAVGARYVLLRPATVRTEWANPARNPKPSYLAEAARAIRAAGIPVVLVADLVAGVEDLVGTLPPHDFSILDGSLETRELLGAAAGAAAVVGGVGWLVPAALALRKPALIVLGGNGAHNAPDKITDPRLDLSRLTFARPDRFCLCERKVHSCDKTITGFPALARSWASSIP